MGQTTTGHFDGSGVGLAPGAPSFRSIYARYSFAIHGGGTGAYSIGTVKKGEVVVGGFMEVIGTPTAVSGTPTMAVSVESANDISTAASILGAPWSTTGKKAITPKINTPESTSITATQDRDITLTIGAAAVNTGNIAVRLIVMGGLDS